MYRGERIIGQLEEMNGEVRTKPVEKGESHAELAHEVTHHLDANESAAVGLHNRAESALKKFLKMIDKGDHENVDKMKELEGEIDSLLNEYKAKNAELSRKVVVAETRFKSEEEVVITDEDILDEISPDEYQAELKAKDRKLATNKITEQDKKPPRFEATYDGDAENADEVENFNSKEEYEGKLVDEAMRDYRAKRTTSGRVRLEKSLTERTERKKAGKFFEPLINVGKINRELKEHRKNKMAADVKPTKKLLTAEASVIVNTEQLYGPRRAAQKRAEFNARAQAKGALPEEKMVDEGDFFPYGDGFEHLPVKPIDSKKGESETTQHQAELNSKIQADATKHWDTIFNSVDHAYNRAKHEARIALFQPGSGVSNEKEVEREAQVGAAMEILRQGKTFEQFKQASIGRAFDYMPESTNMKEGQDRYDDQEVKKFVNKSKGPVQRFLSGIYNRLFGKI